MKESDKFNKAVLVLILIIIILMLASCLEYVPEEELEEIEVEPDIIEEEVEQQKSEISEGSSGTEEEELVEETEKPEEVAEEEEVEGEPIEEQAEQVDEEQIPARVSEVEFYFLLKKKAYFKHILKENEKKTYNVSGFIVSIEPIFIAQNEVKFKINNFTTKALEEKDSDSTQEFEIIVKDIYYRQ
ncbi:hypothetical protein KY348_05220 [Candidatus Woesearchaeota archaeon]|nr:hypothetical protein [Candidatus Woesearchaeota archaeon]